MAVDKLATYRKKRTFASTREPMGLRARKRKSRIFVVQKHRASHLHYDLRLEAEGVLKSWAVPKDFEGTIPKGNYGAGEVIVWDRGTYRAGEGDGEAAILKGLRRGALGIVLRGKKLKGGFSLVRLKRPRQWLLIKKNDSYASTRDVTLNDKSVKSGKRLSDVSGSRRHVVRS
jgi:bifunctional non-homologous end joining protein LigD